ncbi:hypothetical protein AKJ44_01820 [candidate division MSBL1 archaeon SCGC-AAA261F17]|uniref:6-hydroxymethyl-7,8-dihydropterin pyrophosphokinase n=1 Tax=candidate division MSBL1 archaeon SCGC-AAA261F17 TaxID=1698274 RepID=A0A133V676_9EURY|nr:hypothetical protein AKJ44_01820 [candidate division MSBL1 archaeon SCGC-AAA261F17]
MRWILWQPWYDQIVEKLELDKEADYDTAKILEEILPESDVTGLAELVSDKECIILGAGPSLETDLKKIEQTNNLDKVLISADGATSAVINYRNPDVIVTDLDGDVSDQLDAWNQGSWLVIHGHGDNLEKVREITPQLDKRVIGTTQTKAFGKLHNFGGFTDGDRAAFMAHELGASKIYLAGMDLGSEIGKWSGKKDEEKKLIKLEICRELLTWLADELKANLINLTSEGEEIPGAPKKEIN